MQSDAARMAAKWGKTGLLEGLNSEIEKNSMALILENQAKQLVTEQSATNQGGGSFTVGQGAQWAGAHRQARGQTGTAGPVAKRGPAACRCRQPHWYS